MARVAPSSTRVRRFFDALRPGNAATIQRRLGLGMPVDITQGDDGFDALHVAALRAADDVVAVLLGRGANPNHLTTKGSSPLESAAYGGNANVMRQLLAAGANVHDKGAGRALLAALRRKHFEAALVLLRAGANPNAADETTSALEQAIAAGATCELVGELVRAGAEVNGGVLYRPLAAAIGARRMDVLELLLDANADVNGANAYGDTALMHAAGLGALDAVNRLLDRGARVDAREHRAGRTALMMAAQSGHAEVVEALIARGADPALADTDGKTAADHELEGRTAREVALARKVAEEAALAASGVVLRPGRVVAGPFANLTGAAFDAANGKLRVRINIFGRTTEVTLDPDQFAFDERLDG